MLGQARALAGGAGHEPDCALDELSDVLLETRRILGEHRAAHAWQQALVAHVDAIELRLDAVELKQRVPLFLGELADRDVRGIKAGLGVGLPRPRADLEARQEDGSIVKGERFVHDGGKIDVRDGAAALARGAHAAGPFESRELLLLSVDGHAALGRDRGHVERVGAGAARAGLGGAGEEHAQRRRDVRGGTKRRARVGGHGLLPHDDGGGEPLQAVDIRARQRLHEALDETGVGLVDQALRLRGDGVENERGLAGARHAGEDGELALGDVDADAAEVVIAGAGHTDEIMHVLHHKTRATPSTGGRGWRRAD